MATSNSIVKQQLSGAKKRYEFTNEDNSEDSQDLVKYQPDDDDNLEDGSAFYEGFSSREHLSKALEEEEGEVEEEKTEANGKPHSPLEFAASESESDDEYSEVEPEDGEILSQTNEQPADSDNSEDSDDSDDCEEAADADDSEESETSPTTFSKITHPGWCKSIIPRASFSIPKSSPVSPFHRSKVDATNLIVHADEHARSPFGFHAIGTVVPIDKEFRKKYSIYAGLCCLSEEYEPSDKQLNWEDLLEDFTLNHANKETLNFGIVSFQSTDENVNGFQTLVCSYKPSVLSKPFTAPWVRLDGELYFLTLKEMDQYYFSRCSAKGPKFFSERFTKGNFYVNRWSVGPKNRNIWLSVFPDLLFYTLFNSEQIDGNTVYPAFHGTLQCAQFLVKSGRRQPKEEPKSAHEPPSPSSDIIAGRLRNTKSTKSNKLISNHTFEPASTVQISSLATNSSSSSTCPPGPPVVVIDDDDDDKEMTEVKARRKGKAPSKSQPHKSRHNAKRKAPEVEEDEESDQSERESEPPRKRRKTNKSSDPGSSSSSVSALPEVPSVPEPGVVAPIVAPVVHVAAPVAPVPMDLVPLFADPAPTTLFNHWMIYIQSESYEPITGDIIQTMEEMVETLNPEAVRLLLEQPFTAEQFEELITLGPNGDESDDEVSAMFQKMYACCAVRAISEPWRQKLLVLKQALQRLAADLAAQTATKDSEIAEKDSTIRIYEDTLEKKTEELEHMRQELNARKKATAILEREREVQDERHAEEKESWMQKIATLEGELEKQEEKRKAKQLKQQQKIEEERKELEKQEEKRKAKQLKQQQKAEEKKRLQEEKEKLEAEQKQNEEALKKKKQAIARMTLGKK